MLPESEPVFASVNAHAPIHSPDANKGKYFEFEPENGWGSYNEFIIFLADYLMNLKRYPNETVIVGR